jgi:hypothetical protein
MVVVVERYGQGPSRRSAISPSGESAVSSSCASARPCTILFKVVEGQNKALNQMVASLPLVSASVLRTSGPDFLA